MKANKRYLVAAAVAAAAAVVPAAGSATKPALTLVSKRPLVVKGASFHAGERVTVTALTSLGPRIVRITAGAAGGFKATLRIPNQPCAAPFAIQARGSMGAIAVMRVAVTVPCTPPPVD